MITRLWKIFIVIAVFFGIPSSIYAQTCYSNRVTVEGALPNHAQDGVTIDVGLQFSTEDETAFYARFTKASESRWRVSLLRHTPVQDASQLRFDESGGLLNFDSRGELTNGLQTVYQPLSSRLERAGSYYEIDFVGVVLRSELERPIQFVINGGSQVTCQVEGQVEWIKTSPDQVRDELNPIAIE